MDNRIHRNDVNMAKVLSRKKYVCVCMYVYLCMYRVRKMERCTLHLGIRYTMFITCQISWFKDDLIYKVIFEVLHHTKSSKTFYSNYFQ